MMWFFFSVVVVVAAACWFWMRVEVVCLRKLAELRAPAAPTPAPPAEEKSAGMPQALINMALQEHEDWARNDALKAMRELYDVTRDWGAVQAAFLGRK